VEADAKLPAWPVSREIEGPRWAVPSPLPLEAWIEIILIPPCISVEQRKVRSTIRVPEVGPGPVATPEVHVSEAVAT
jgi:hypothetical protein